jgi:hypothetical protein
VEIEGSGLGQPFDDPKNPEYLEKLATWFYRVQNAIFELAVIDSLVVPDDNEWAWKLREAGIPIPESGLDRQRAYVEEALDELIRDPHEERRAFVNAVVQISVPIVQFSTSGRGRYEKGRHYVLTPIMYW